MSKRHKKPERPRPARALSSPRGTRASGLPPTRADLLARLDALGMTAKVFLERAGLAPAFVSKARAGAGTDAKASASWAKFEATLVELERERAGGVTLPAAERRPSGARAGAGGGGVPGSATAKAALAEAILAASPEIAPGGGAEIEELFAKIESSKSAAELSELQRLVGQLAAKGPTRGGISPDVARVLIQCITEQRQLLREQREEEERNRAGEAVEVRVIYVDSWRERTAVEVKGGVKSEGVNE